MASREPAPPPFRSAPRATHELRTAPSHPWVLLGIGGVIGGLFVTLAVVMLVQGGLLAALVVGAMGSIFAWPLITALRPQGIVVTPGGVALRGPEGRSLKWDDIEGLGAARVVVPGIASLTRFYVYTRDEADLEFNSEWPGYERVAAAIQARRFDPDARLDLDRALGDPPRGDPAAALGMDPSALMRFAREVRAVLAAAGVTARVSEKRLRAEADDGGVFELFAVGRRCAAMDEGRWPKVLRAHFAKVLAAREAAAKVLSSDATLESERDRLTLQVFPARDAGAQVSEPLGGTGLERVVVVDVGEADVSVAHDRLAQWGTTRDELFAIARASLAKLSPPTRETQATSPAVIFRGERAAARVTELRAWMELDDRLGAIVGVPAQDVVVALPLRNAADLLFLSMGSFGVAIGAAHRDDAKPLSDGVFWLRGDELTPIPLVVTREGPTWVVPDALSGALVGRDSATSAA